MSEGGPAGRGRRPPRQTRQSREDTQAIRQWAREQGYQVSERGRIPNDVVAATRPPTPGRAEVGLLAK